MSPDIDFGRPMPRREDDRLLSGSGQYTDDVPHADALRAVFVRSPYGSALIRSIDVAAAQSQPGVVAVLTWAELVADLPAGQDTFRQAQGDGSFAEETPRPLLVHDRVRCLGEPVAMVLADTEQAAMDAAELVTVNYEDQPAVTEAFEALDPHAPQLWAERPGNVGFHWRGGDRDGVQAALATSAHVTRLKFRVSRVAAMPLEPRAALAYVGDDGRPVLRASHQSPHLLRADLAALFGLQATELRVLIGDVGGSFGMKAGPLREEMAVFWAARRLQRAVRWTALRTESFLSDEHGRDVWISGELGLDGDGKFTALGVRYDVNIGAYMTGRSGSPITNIGGIAGVYTTPVIAADIVGVLTNTQQTAAYRGAGRPDATYAIERLIDLAAAETGVDPAELRRRNLIPPEAMPYRTPFIFTYDCGDFERNLDQALLLADYTGFAKRRDEARPTGHLRGIGIAMPIETAGGIGEDQAVVRAHSDGTVTIYAGSMSVGQGHETAFAAILAQRLGLPMDRILHVQGDTDRIAGGKGNGGSSALVMGGTVVTRGADDLVEKAKRLAAASLEVSAEDLSFSNGAFRVAGTDLEVTLGELVRRLEADASDGAATLSGSAQFKPQQATFPNGCHICEVDIDASTGLVTVVKYVCVEDVGRVLNPLLVEGQIHGGVVQGIGQALLEEIRYDGTGQLQTGSFMDYAMPRATDIPLMVCLNLETPTALNPLGVKGVGEAGTVGAMSATMNAVCNALQVVGLRHLDMPATPTKVWEALHAAGFHAGA
jgi:carbon-monoxide dehydrogenase large subunit